MMSAIKKIEDPLAVYRTRFPGHAVALRGARVGRAEVAVLIDKPLGVVRGGEVADGVAELVDGLEDAAMDGLLFRRSEEPPEDAVRLRLGHKVGSR